MAVDAALLASVQEGGQPAVRFYRWSPACLSFGRNQPTRGLYDTTLARSLGIDFVRRPTGGQAVLHDDELTYAVVAPVDRIGRPRAAYRRINEALVAGLQTLGVAAAVSPPWGTRRPEGADVRAVSDWREACFRRPAPGEVVVAGRKLIGSAQRMEGRVVLQHGSLLVGGSQSAAEDLLLERVTPASPGAVPDAPIPGAPGWITLEAELGGRPDWAELLAALVDGFQRALGTSFAPSGLTLREVETASRFQERFASDEWTWRR